MWGHEIGDIASGKETIGDTTTLEEYSVLAKLQEEEQGRPYACALIAEHHRQDR